MKFNRSLEANNSYRYVFDCKIKSGDFFTLIDALGDLFGVKPEFVAMPEADVAKIKIGCGEIYAKYDLDYGIEIECTGLASEQLVGCEELFIKS